MVFAFAFAFTFPFELSRIFSLAFPLAFAFALRGRRGFRRSTRSRSGGSSRRTLRRTLGLGTRRGPSPGRRFCVARGFWVRTGLLDDEVIFVGKIRVLLDKESERSMLRNLLLVILTRSTPGLES